MCSLLGTTLAPFIYLQFECLAFGRPAYASMLWDVHMYGLSLHNIHLTLYFLSLSLCRHSFNPIAWHLHNVGNLSIYVCEENFRNCNEEKRSRERDRESSVAILGCLFAYTSNNIKKFHRTRYDLMKPTDWTRFIN